MSRKSPRYIPPGALVDITAQTVGSKFLLRPSPAFNAAVLSILGRALSLLPLDLHAVAFMSNHWHCLVSVADAQAASRFVQFVHGNLARIVQSLVGWDGRVFRKASYIVVGTAGEEQRLRYVLSQGAKEGLVRRPVDWPGVHSARALIGEEVLVGVWREREHERKIRTGGGNGGGRAPSAAEASTRYLIDLVPLPSWRLLDAAERFTRVRRLLDDIEREARTKHAAVAGARRVLNMDPFDKPLASKRSPAPKVHTPDEDERIAFTEGHLAFCEQLAFARDALRREKPAILPAGCFPPVPPFRTTQAALWSASRTEDA
jgi:hypothetical protein